MADTSSPAWDQRRGFAIARKLIEDIEAAERIESTLEWDLFAVADRIDRAFAVDDEGTRLGLLLAMADYLTSAASGGGVPDAATWKPCRREDGTFMWQPAVE